MSKTTLESRAIQDLSSKADKLLIAKEHDKLKELLEPFLGIEHSFDNCFDEAHYHYTLGNCFQAIYGHQKSDWFSTEVGKSVISYRKALHAVQKINPPTNNSLYLQGCIETNLGNCLSSQGRVFCCIPFWDSAYRCTKNPISLISKAKNELFIASSVYDEGHSEQHYLTAYQLIQLGLENLEKLHPEQKVAYSKDSDLIRFKAWYEEHFSLDTSSNSKTYKMDTDSRKHRDYLKWSAENRLFINDLNDISISERDWQDILTLPPITGTINDTLSLYEELMYHGSFDEIKNDYCYARYLVFVAKDIPNDQSSLFNDTYPHVDDMAYTITNLKSSHYKSAFRTLYSLFDKIAYFIHRFFDLGSIGDKVEWSVSHKSIFRGVNDEKSQKVKLKDSDNCFIHALSYILKDVSEVKNVNENTKGASYWLDPDVKAFSEIRNAIEHRSLKIIDDFGYELTQSDRSYTQLKLEDLEKELNETKAHIEEISGKIALAEKVQDIVSKEELKSKKLTFDKKLERLQLKLLDKQKLSSHSLLIRVSDFESRLMTLLHLTRNSIMYLSLAIHFEEQSKQNNNSFVISRELPIK